MREQLQWTAPAPLWGTAADAANVAARRSTLLRPAVLRFASDTFMEDFLALMQNDPARLGEFVAQPETWRGPAQPVAPPAPAPKFLQTLTRLRLAAVRQKQPRAQLVASSSSALNSVAGTIDSRPPAAGAAFGGATATLALSLSSRSTLQGRTPLRPLPGVPTRPPAPAPKLKLYQPAHQRFYLLAACL
ncbi:MAG TPA: hypothetical protein VF525_14820, partial [Pyrinomonadaceae bacterium]